MGSTALKFLIVNAIPLSIGLAIGSLLIFLVFHRIGKGLGGAIIALLFSLFYIFVPMFGGYLTLSTGIMAAIIRVHHVWLSITVVILNILNILMFSPLLRSNAAGGIQAGDYKWAIFFIALAVVQAAIGLFIFFRYMEYKKEETLSEPEEYSEVEEIELEEESHRF